jgi:hypothetical protein
MEMIQTTDINGRAVWVYVINGIEIADAYTSECGRFDVTPDYYGLTVYESDKLAAANRLA